MEHLYLSKKINFRDFPNIYCFINKLTVTNDTSLTLFSSFTCHENKFYSGKASPKALPLTLISRSIKTLSTSIKMA